LTLAIRTTKRLPMLIDLPLRWATRAPVVRLSFQMSRSDEGRSDTRMNPSIRNRSSWM